MVVTNKDRIITMMHVYRWLFILNCLIVVTAYILRSFIIEELRWLAIGVFIIVTLLIIIKILELKIFYFENSGSIFSIKYYHPAKKGIVFPLIEYPVDKLRALKIERAVFSDTIIVDVDIREKDKPLRIKMKVWGINNGDYRKMVNSFTNE